MKDHEKNRISQALRAAADELGGRGSREDAPEETTVSHLQVHENLRNAILTADADPVQDDIKKEFIKVTRRYISRGYEIRLELWHHHSSEEPTEMRSAYSIPHGYYIGEPLNANNLFRKFGITQWEKRTPESNVCSIGYSPRRKKWYGWSHRAIGGFGVGSVLKEGSTGVKSVEDGEFMGEGMDPGKVKTLDQAKQAACEFAKCVAWVTDTE